MEMTLSIGADGLPQDDPALLYTEKVLHEKEAELRKFIQENYSKIRNVEKELTDLTFQVKLTAGSRKAALEHLRKKIEVSGEKIKKAKLKEEQARKAWELAQKALKDEEAEKLNLCQDLTRLVQESASAQYSRLEELKTKLEALRPDGSATTPVVQPSQSAVQDAVATSKVASVPVAPLSTPAAPLSTPAAPPSTPLTQENSSANANAATKGRVRVGKGRGRGSLVIQSIQGPSAWTGAGFDVESLE